MSDNLENKNNDNHNAMSPTSSSSTGHTKADVHKKNDSPLKSSLVTLLLVGALGYFIFQNPQRAWNIFLVILGFSAVIFVHELGHFIAAKSVGIMVEAFSIGFGPVLLGIKKVKGGFGIRILPTLLPGKDNKGVLYFRIPLGFSRDGETEYRLSLLPLGGFVKMLGQEDVGADKPCDDPRAFGNKAVWQRAVVISAGVIMNVISGAIAFMIVFAHGLELPPAVVGHVIPDRPAALAGIKGGDEIIGINNKKNVDFTDLTFAAAFADTGEKVDLHVRHPDDSEETFQVEPMMPQTEAEKEKGIKIIGIYPADTLIIDDLEKYPEEFIRAAEKLGFKSGDEIVAVNGKEISRYDQLYNELYPAPGVMSGSTVTLTVKRKDASGQTGKIDISLPMVLSPVLDEDIKPQVLGMIPRIKVIKVLEGSSAQEAGVKDNDVILRFGTLSYPRKSEFQEYCKNNGEKELELLVARRQEQGEKEYLLHVTPRRPKMSFLKKIFSKQSDPVVGVVIVAGDFSAATIADVEKYANDLPPLTLPRGSLIKTVAGQAVNNWADIIKLLIKKKGQEVEIAYQASKDQPVNNISVSVPDNREWLGYTFRPDLGDLFQLPLVPLKRLYKADNWKESLQMGADRTYVFIAQTYLMLRGMAKRNVSPKSISGPVGILKMSYNVVEQKSFSRYLYFMALISVCIAVFNFLPLPILDGGYIVMLIVEKIKGSPVSIKVQEIINYIGLFLILALVLFVTYNDILKVISGQI